MDNKKVVKIYVKKKSLIDVLPGKIKQFVKKIDSFIDRLAKQLTNLILSLIRRKPNLHLQFQSAYETFNDLFEGKVKSENFLYLALKAYLYGVILLYVGCKILMGLDIGILDIALAMILHPNLKNQIESMIPPDKKLKMIAKTFIQAGLIAHAIFWIFGIVAIVKELMPVLSPIFDKLDEKLFMASAGVEQ